jgi:hypothetical protein
MHEGWSLVARSRNIKPGFFMNEKLVELPFEARLMFIGLWTLADREGRLEDRPLRIKMSLFPADNIDTDDLLQMLHDAGFIQRYEVDNQSCIQVTAFKKHQNPHVKEAASVLPAPDEHQTSTGQDMTKADTSRADSLNLIPDSPLSDSSAPDDAGEGERDDYPSKPNLHEQRFEKFWQAYPKKQNKGSARKVWLRIKPTDDLLDTMVASIDRHKRWEQWTKNNGQFIPLPATWLNADGWLNEIDGKPSGVAPKSDADKTALEKLEDEYQRYKNDPMLGYGPERATRMYDLKRQIAELEAQS